MRGLREEEWCVGGFGGCVPAPDNHLNKLAGGWGWEALGPHPLWYLRPSATSSRRPSLSMEPMEVGRLLF